MTVDEILEELERLLRDVDSYHQMREGLRKIIEQSGEEHVGTVDDMDIRNLGPLSADPRVCPAPVWRCGPFEGIDYSKLIFHTDEDNVW